MLPKNFLKNNAEIAHIHAFLIDVEPSTDDF